MVKELKYNMDVLDQGSVEGDLKENISIKPKVNTEVNLPVKIAMKHLGKTLFQIITDHDNYNYILHLNAELVSPDISNQTFHLHIVKKGKLELKK